MQSNTIFDMINTMFTLCLLDRRKLCVWVAISLWMVAGLPQDVVAQSIAGTVFEDVQYGGGAGRDHATASGSMTGVDNVTVELYTLGGAFVAPAVMTSGGGQYTFSNASHGITAGVTYMVRVVNHSVGSTRPSNGTGEVIVPVQTYRIDNSGAVTNQVGGEVPAEQDVPANNGSQSLAALAALTGDTSVQSISAVTSTSGNITGIDFGFNFDTIVNVNDAGQGSLRQFIINANELGGDTSLAQEGQTLDQDVLAGTDVEVDLPEDTETSIFMISDGSGAAGTSGNSLLSGDGVARIEIMSGPLPALRDPNTRIDGRTQTKNIGDTNTVHTGCGSQCWGAGVCRDTTCLGCPRSGSLYCVECTVDHCARQEKYRAWPGIARGK